jgi:hypothetical protein
MLATLPEPLQKSLASPSAPAALLSRTSQLKIQGQESSVVDTGHAVESKLVMMTTRRKKIQAKEFCVELFGNVEGPLQRRRPTTATDTLAMATWVGSPPLPVTPSTLLVNTFHAALFQVSKMLTPTPTLPQLDVDSFVVLVPIRHHREKSSYKHQS